MSLRWRIALAYVGLIAAATLFLSVFLLRTVRDYYLDRLEMQLVAQARVLADDAGGRLAAGGDLDSLAKTLGIASGARITIIAPDGTVLGDSHEDPARMENHAGRPEVVQALAEGVGGAARHSTTVGYDMMYTAVPIMESGQLLGVARVALPMVDVDRSLEQMARTVLVAAAATGGIAILLALAIARATTQPVKELTALAGALAAGDLDRRVHVESRDEIGDLGRAFNRMAERLQENMAAITRERNEAAAILTYMDDGIVIAGPDGQVRLVNPAAERILHLPRGEAQGRTITEVVRSHELVQLVQESMAKGQPGTHFTRLVELEPGRRRVRAVATGIGGASLQGAMLVLQDMTDVWRLESLRRDFVANVSHELRTPLASLKALVETLEAGALEDPPAAREFLGRMHVEVDGLAQLVEELLELSRIESGQVAMHLEPVDVAGLTALAVERLRPLADRQGVFLEVHAPSDLPPVMADPQRLQQAVVNLVHNAIKFNHAGGRVLVAIRAEDGELLVSVTDTGLGIGPDDLPRVFERFYKGDRSRSSQGTGLGLAIVKHVVQAHGGRVWADSAGPGRGATFTLALPAGQTRLAAGDAAQL